MHRTQLHSVARSRRGKVFSGSTRIHMWLQFKQSKISASMERLRLVSYDNGTSFNASSYPFPGLKMAKAICVIVFHLKLYSCCGCKSEWRCEMG